MTPSPCDPNEQCQNTIGSYNCGCVVGYVKDDKDQSCIDYDECEGNTHSCHIQSKEFRLQSLRRGLYKRYMGVYA